MFCSFIGFSFSPLSHLRGERACGVGDMRRRRLRWLALSAVLPVARSFDVYGFEPVRLPPLPSGAYLALEQVHAAPLPSDTVEMLRSYLRSVRHDGEIAGGRLWPAVSLLCSWLGEPAQAERLYGSHVLELGAGVGAGGLYAAALGARHVTLTDGGGEEVLSLLRRNANANAGLLGEGAHVCVSNMKFGDRHAALLYAGRVDWVICADVLYGECQSGSDQNAEDEAWQDARTRANELAETMDYLLHAQISGGEQASGVGEVTANVPRVIVAHEHRERSIHGPLRWNEDDPTLSEFIEAAARRGLCVREIRSERPQVLRNDPPFRHWSADLSLLEVGKEEHKRQW